MTGCFAVPWGWHFRPVQDTSCHAPKLCFGFVSVFSTARTMLATVCFLIWVLLAEMLTLLTVQSAVQM